MGRAELRRAEKAKKKKEAVYCYTQAQLDQVVKKTIEDQFSEIRETAIDNAVTVAMTLSFILPLKVLMEYYWPGSYKKKIPEFTNHLMDYYRRWESGELDIDELSDELWELAGVRFEEKDAE